MTQQKSRDDLNLIGEFIIVSDIPNNPLIAIVTGIVDNGAIKYREDPDTGALTIVPFFSPVIEEMQASQAIGLMEDAFNKALATIKDPNAKSPDAAIARNRKEHLGSTLKQLKRLAP